MTYTRERTEITDVADLRQLAEDVRSSGTPRLLVLGDEEVAMLVPVDTPVSSASGETRDDEHDDLQEFLSAAGSWNGYGDPGAFMRRVREGRSSSRPVVTSPDSGT